MLDETTNLVNKIEMRGAKNTLTNMYKHFFFRRFSSVICVHCGNGMCHASCVAYSFVNSGRVTALKE